MGKAASTRETVRWLAPLFFAVVLFGGVLVAACEDPGPTPIGNHPEDPPADAGPPPSAEAGEGGGDDASAEGGDPDGGTDGGSDADAADITDARDGG